MTSQQGQLVPAAGSRVQLRSRLGALTLLLLCAVQLLDIVDASIVNVALPSIRADLHFSLQSLQWVLIAYAITFGGFLLLGGRLADLLGRRRIFMIGVAVFSAASLACGLAGSIGVLVAARAVQGIGAALVSPATLSIITATFPPRERGRYQGYLAGVSVASSTFGPGAKPAGPRVQTHALIWS